MRPHLLKKRKICTKIIIWIIVWTKMLPNSVTYFVHNIFFWSLNNEL